MSRAKKVIVAALCAATVAVVPAFAACSSQPYVTNIAKSGTEGSNDIYTIYYSDGSTTKFTVPNSTVTASDLYDEYIAETGDDITYSEFLLQFITVNGDNTASTINYCLQSCLKIYSEFVETSYSIGFGGITQVSDVNVYTGGAVIYDVDTISDGYTYLVTNYHVIYDNNADASRNGGTKIAREIYGYLYGSESTPVAAGRDSDGYTQYDYGSYGIALEYVGGSVENDLAVLRAKTAYMKAVNENIKAVELADTYYVGETAIAIGNPEGNGISVTQGIISTENELITLNIDGNWRSYRSLRIDTPLYSGNSGGGLFNSAGKLIGITNAGNTEDQNINYAVPLEIVTGTVDNIIYYANDGDDSTNNAYTVDLGVTLSSSNSKYVYDASAGYGQVSEDVRIDSVVSASIAANAGAKVGDILRGVIINGEESEVTRTFNLDDIAITMREGDSVNLVVERDGGLVTLSSCTISSSDLVSLK